MNVVEESAAGSRPVRRSAMRTISGVLRGNSTLGLLFAVAAFALALIVRFEVGRILPSGFPYITFFPAIILTTFLAGTRPGVLCAALSGIASWYFFIAPVRSFVLDGPAATALCFFLFIAAVDIALIHYMELSRERLSEQRSVSSSLYEQQRAMFAELQHRVANNMSFVSSLLSLEQRRVAADPASAVAVMEEAQRRITVMSRVHRRLYRPEAVEMSLEKYFCDLCEDLREGSGAGNVHFNVDMDPVRLDIGKMMTLSLLVTEIVTNSLKHGVDEQPSSQIGVMLRDLGPAGLELTVRDSGPGFPDDHEERAGHGLGSRIARGFAAQLGGQLAYSNEDGAVTRLVFPRPQPTAET